MRDSSSRAGSRLRSQLAIPITILLFVALVVIADRGLGGLRLDLTEDRRFSLSEASRSLIAEIDEPITVNLYRSSLLTDVNPAYASHAKRVRNLLEEMARLSGGNIRVALIDPKPFSPEEDLAVADGIEAISAGDGTGDLVYFGLSARNSVDDLEVLPFLDLERAGFLEYDIASMFASLGRQDKGRVGVVSSLPLTGDRLDNFQPQLTFELMQQLFDLSEPDLASGQVPEEITLMMLVQPTDLSSAALYAVDQFVLRGGRLLLFLDPFSERNAVASQQGVSNVPGPSDLSLIAPLLAAWGIEIPQGEIAADRLSARRVLANVQGRPEPTDYVAWLSIPKAQLADDDPMVAQLQRLNFNTAGLIRATENDESVNFLPLAWTTREAEVLPVDKIAFQPDPGRLLADYAPAGDRLVLAARIEGRMSSAFPDGPPAELRSQEGIDFASLEAKHRSQSKEPARIVAVADSDFLLDYVWLRQGSGRGGQPVPTANNGDFLINALEDLSGAIGLSGLRGRGLTDRPFTVMEELRRDAELKFRKREEALVAEIRRAEERIGALQESSDGGVALTQEQAATIEALRGELLAARRELRDVQRSLRDDLESLVSRIQLANILGIPLVIALLGLIVMIWRRRRALRGAAAARH